MGIVSRDNVHNVNVTARVRRVCISIYGHHVCSRDNVHNVRVTARVIYSTCIRLRISYPYMGTVKSCEELYTMSRLLRGSDAHEHILFPYMGIMYTHVTMYIHNVRVTARVMYMYMTKTITSVYGHCIDTSQTSTTLNTRTCLYTLYTMLTIVRGCTCTLMPTSEHTLIHNQYHIHIW